MQEVIMKRLIVIVFCLSLATQFVFAEDTDPTEYQARYYENAKVVRIKYAQGEAFVKRGYEEGLEEATPNLPLFENDRIETTTGRLELYLGRSNYLRLDADSEAVLTKVPVLRKTNMAIRLFKGGLYLDYLNLDYEKDVEIQTPDCGIFLLDRGIYRINTSADGETEIYIFEGTAEVAGDHDARTVRSNQKIVMSNGKVVERPFYFNTSDRDEFDAWNDDRNRIIGYARHGSSRYLRSGYEDQEYELSRHGRWEYDDTYTSYVWIPYNIGPTWRPYWHGRWIWTPYYGYVWNSFDNWGWYTHYYGRWHWGAHRGWHWIPGYRWSPAWVHWFWDGSYYGWCPISYWNRPIVLIGNRWYRNHHYRRGIPFHSRSNTIIRKNQLSASHIHKVALRRSTMNKMSSHTLGFHGSGPKIRPAHGKVNAINARGQTVAFKQGGIVSSGKYRAGPAQGMTGKTGAKGSLRYTGTKGANSKAYKYSGRGQSTRSTTRTAPGYRSIKTYRSSGKSSAYSRTTKSYQSRSSTSKRYRSSTARSGKSTSSRGSSKSSSSKTRRKKDGPYAGSQSRAAATKRYVASGSTQTSRQRSTTKRYGSTTTMQNRHSGDSSRRTTASATRYGTPDRSSSYSRRSSSYSGKTYTSRAGTRSYRTPTRSSVNRSYRSRGYSTPKSVYRGSSSRSHRSGAYSTTRGTYRGSSSGSYRSSGSRSTARSSYRGSSGHSHRSSASRSSSSGSSGGSRKKH